MPPDPEEEAYTPSPLTEQWLASLPVPPGATTDCRPRCKEDWILAERWHTLVQGIEILGRAQRWRLEAEGRKGWDDRAKALLPLVETLQLSESTDLESLVQAHTNLRLPPPTTGAPPPPLGAFSVPALFSAIQELEESVLTLRLEVEQASKLQHGLESELESRVLMSDAEYASKPRRIAEGKAELQRSLNSTAMLDKKADEYRTRLAHLQATITAQLSRQSSITGGASVQEVQELVEQNAEYERLRAQEASLVNSLASHGEVVPPPNAQAAKRKSGQKKDKGRSGKSGRR